jgi:hypothetical protein
MAKKYVLLIVTAGDCPACQDYKSKYHTIFVSAVRNKFPNVRIVEANKPSMNSTLQISGQPRNLSAWVAWYPEFILMPEDNWSKEITQSAVIYNGRYVSGSGAQLTVNQRPTSDSLVQWIGTYAK